MKLDKFKDVHVGDHDFRVGRVSAEIGSWIMTQVSLGTIGEPEIYATITRHLFNLISVWQIAGDGTRMPMLIYSDGTYLVPELQLDYDLELFETLYKEAWDFNFAPFFAKRKKQFEEAQEARKIEEAHKRSITSR